MAIGVQTDMATPALSRFGSEELAKEFLVPSIKGDYVACLGVSEVGAGSDVASIKTTAKKDGGDYVINGGKMWTTSGTQADWMCLLANTSDGSAHKNKSLICLPMKTKGVNVARKLDKLGMRCSDTAQIFFEDVRVPQRYRIGKEGEGFTYQMLQFQEERLYAAAAGLVAKERMIEETIEYTGQRKAFGQSILDNQVVHFRLAELKTEVEMLRALTYRAARTHAEGRGRDDARLHGQAEVGAAVARNLGRLPAVLGRHGLHERDRHLPRLSRHAAGLHRRRRGRDHAVHHLQAHGHPAGQAEQVVESEPCGYETLIVDRDGPVMKVTLKRRRTCRQRHVPGDACRQSWRRLSSTRARTPRCVLSSLWGPAETSAPAATSRACRNRAPRRVVPETAASSNRTLRRLAGDGRFASQGRDRADRGCGHGRRRGAGCHQRLGHRREGRADRNAGSDGRAHPAQIAPFVVKRIGYTHARRHGDLRPAGSTPTMLCASAWCTRLADNHGELMDKGAAAINQCLRCAPGGRRRDQAAGARLAREPLGRCARRGIAEFAAALAGDAREGIRAFLEKRKPAWMKKIERI